MQEPMEHQNLDLHLEGVAALAGLFGGAGNRDSHLAEERSRFRFGE